MSLNVGQLFVEINIDFTKYQASLNTAKGMAQTAGTDIEKGFAGIKLGDLSGNVLKFGSSFGIASALATTAINAIIAAVKGIGDAIADVIKTGAGFEQQMANINAVAFQGLDRKSDAVKQSMQDLEDTALKMGVTTKFTATEAGAGLEILARAGFSAKESIAALPGVLALAAAEDISVADSADIATNALRQFGLAVNQTTVVADVLAQASADSSASVQGLGQSLKYLGPIAQTLGINIFDASAALEILANNGIKGTMAGRNLASGLTSLMAPTAAAKDLMKELGINVKDAQGNLLSLPEILGNLHTSFSKLSEAQQIQAAKTIFGRDNMKTLLPLIRAGETDINKLADALHKSSGAAAEMAAVKMDTVQGQWKLLKSTVETLGISIFKVFGTDFKTAITTANSLITSAGPVIVAIFQGIRSAIISIGSAALPGLIAAWKALAPAIASAIPVMGQIAGIFVQLASQAAGWGGKIIAQIAAGMAKAIQTVVAVLQKLGAIIRYWLSPHSPPPIVPELDQYGTDTAQLYVDSFAKADVASPMQSLGDKIIAGLKIGVGKISQTVVPLATAVGKQVADGLIGGWSSGDFKIFGTIAKSVEDIIRSFGSSGAIPKDGVIPLILGSRTALHDAIDSIRQFGSVSKEALDKVLQSVGPVAPEIEGLITSYFDLEAASRAVAEAQQELNDVTQAYAERISPLQDQLDEINKQQQKIRDMERIAELQKTLSDDGATDAEKQLAALEIQEIQVREQIDAVTEEKDNAVDAAQTKLDAAKQTQDAAQEAFDSQQAAIEQASTTNALMQEQLSILKQIADEAKNKGGGAGGGGGIGDIGVPEPIDGGLPDFGKMAENVSPLDKALHQLNDTIESFKSGYASVTGIFDTVSGKIAEGKGYIDGIGGAWNTVITTVQPIIDSYNSLVTTVMGMVNDVIGQDAGQTPGFFADAWDQIKTIWNTGKEIISGVVDKISGYLKKLQGDVASHKEAITTTLEGAWTFIQGTIKTALGAIEIALSIALGVLTGDWKKAWEGIKTGCADVVLGIQKAIKGFLDFIAGLFGTSMDEINKTWDGNWKKLLKAIDPIIEGIKKAWDQFGKDCKELGSNIVKGFTAGVLAEAENLYKAAADVVSGAIAAAKAAIGSHSPSKVAEKEVGITIPQGIANGIIAGADMVRLAAIQLMDGVLATFIQGKTQIIAAFGDLTDYLSGQASLISATLSSSNALSGMIPDDKNLESAKDQYAKLLNTIQDTRDAILKGDSQLIKDRQDIMKDLANFQKKTNDDVLKAQQDGAKKLRELQIKIGTVNNDLEHAQANPLTVTQQEKVNHAIQLRRKIAEQIHKLEASKNANDALTQERIADLRLQDAETAKDMDSILADAEEKRQDKIATLLAKKQDLLTQIKETQENTVNKVQDLEQKYADKKLELLAKIKDTEEKAASKRIEQLQTEASLVQQFGQARIELEKQYELLHEENAIADKARYDTTALRATVDYLAQFDPKAATDFFNQRSKEIEDLAKLQEQLLTETDSHKIAAINEQIALTKQLGGTERAEILASITKEVADAKTKDDITQEQIDALDLRLSLAKQVYGIIEQTNIGGPTSDAATLQRISTNLVAPEISSMITNLSTQLSGFFAALTNQVQTLPPNFIPANSNNNTRTSTSENNTTFQVNATYPVRQTAESVADELRLLAMLRRG